MRAVNKNSEWLIRSGNSQNSRIRLFCFPYAGGGIQTYAQWKKVLPDFVELISVQPPGRGARIMEPAFSCIHELVERLFIEYLTVNDKPCVFYGHSMGGWVALALCNKLMKAGHALPRHLILAGCRPPGSVRRPVPVTELNNAQFIEVLRKLKGTPPQILENEEFLSLYLPTLRADFQAVDEFKCEPEEKLPVPASLFYGLEEEAGMVDLLQGWSDYFSVQPAYHSVQGGHFFVESNRDAVLGEVNKILYGCDKLRPGLQVSA